MKLVQTSNPKKPEVNLEMLMIRKAELKQQLREQEQVVAASARRLFSPVSFSTCLFRSFSKGFSMLDGILLGYRLMHKFKRLFRRS